MNLLEELSADGSYAAYEEIEHLIFGKEERVVYGVERLTQILAVYDKRYVGLRSTLRTGYDADAATSECAEELSCNARRMLHVLSHDGYCGKSLFGVHGEHGSCLNLLGKLAVEHFHGSCFVLIAYADGRGVLRGSLRHHEAADAVVGKRCEDTTVDTDDAHHGESCYGDEGGAADAGDALDGLVIVGYLRLYDGALGVRIECVLDADGDVLHADGIDGRGIDDLCAEIAKLHRLYIAKFVYGVGSLDDTRIGGHESVYVGPDLKNVCIEGCSNDGSRIVRSATSEICGLVGVAIHAYKTWNERNAWKVAERALHQSASKV